MLLHGTSGAFAGALLLGSLGVVATLFWVCGAAIASTLGIFIFAPWLILAATLTAVGLTLEFKLPALQALTQCLLLRDP